MNKKYFRVEDDIWDAALTRARSEGTPLSVVLREFLVRYVSEGDEAGVVTELEDITTRLERLSNRLAVQG